MKAKVKIMSYAVLQNALSVKLICETPGGLVNEAKDEKRKVGLDDLSFEAKVKSISIRRGLANILVRTKKSRYVASKLFELMEKEAVEFTISEILDQKISSLLSKASRKLGEPEEELLLRLTTFRDKEGNEILGKRTLQDISEGQKEVVLRKLNNILSAPPKADQTLADRGESDSVGKEEIALCSV